MKSFVKTSLITLGLLYALLLFAFTNPFNWFVPKSSKLSQKRFESVHVGMKKDDLIRLLGQPLKVQKIEEPYPDCEKCFVYHFTGEPPEWLISYKEAWVYVGSEGLVRRKIWHVEP